MPNDNEKKQNTSPELSELRARRGTIKGQVTKFSIYLQKLNTDEPLTSVKRNELTLKLNKFIELLNKFDELQTSIEVLNKDNLELELTIRDELEENLHFCIATAQDILEMSSPKKVDEDKDSSSSHHSSCKHDSHESSYGFQLPLIKISKFDGAYFKWMEFRDTFESLVHSNDRIKPIHKFHYLNSYLEGEASRVIANLEVSAANYIEAWNLLCERFNNKRQLVTNHLNSLFSIDSLQRESDKSLRYLSDHITKNLRALKSLGLPTDQWDAIIIHMVTMKLDDSTGTKWEEHRKTLGEFPTFEDFKIFLKDRADVLESRSKAKKDFSKQPVSRQSPLTNNQSHRQVHSNNFQRSDKYTKSFVISAEPNNLRPCVVCQDKHRVYDCEKFKSYAVDERWAQVDKLKLCRNCLRADHELKRCRLSGCRVCKGRHNTLLHKDTTQRRTTSISNETKSNDNADASTSTSSSISMSALSTIEVLLSTAIVNVVNPCNNQVEKVRALLDCGSQSSFMTESLKRRLNLTSQPRNVTSVLGIGNSSLSIIPDNCQANIQSLQGPFSTKLNFLVLPQITDTIPKQHVDVRHLHIPPSFQLADPRFNEPSHIDVLLGADVFWDLVGTERHSLGEKQPQLCSSKLGWLIAGSVTNKIRENKSSSIHCNFSVTENIDSQLTKFWELESFPSGKEAPSSVENACEQHFIENTYRLDNGRFCVRLPLIDSSDCLGDSYFMARKRFLNLEKRFIHQPQLKEQYTDFIDEYRDLGHLSENSASITEPYYLPHHAVLKESSESTKLRVVFDASARTTSGYSINDLQMVGPNIQDSLFNILLRFRQYRYVLSGDIEKQYRQILVNELDRHLQTILWRENQHLPLRSLTLNTVTYGFASASFLASRCLWQLGEECNDPLVRSIIQNDFYCDDLLSGADDEDELLRIQQSIAKALASGCFNLRKYRSNSNKVLQTAAANNDDNGSNLVLSQSYQTLGMGWNPARDTLHFPINSTQDKNTKITKRSILSTTFKIFDPLGVLSICTIKPKMLLQKLWSLQIGWDDPVPAEVQRTWSRFINNLHSIENISVPRNVLSSPSQIELHCFCDASQCAYGACIYIKSIDSSGEQHVNLLCAKSRVSPMKPTTIPRLELCGALLAAQLSAAVSAALKKPIARFFYWTDSSVVLAWINTCPSQLKVFVANRVAAITELTEPSSWRYVPTSLNPADLASRGVDPQHVQDAQLWWHGPEFLTAPESTWPTLNNNMQDDLPDNLPETKTPTVLVSQVDTPSIDFERFSRFRTLQRVVAYVRRFIHNCKKSNSRFTGPLSTEELNDSYSTLVKIAQQESFPKELQLLQQNKALSPKSNILSLTPFLDSQGILRVGGRLDASQYTFDKKHPMLLHAKHSLTKLIFTQEHSRLLHAGPQLMLATIRETIWPVGGRELARRTARSCTACRRAAGRALSNIMGNLPAHRLMPDFPFCASAVDFAGPFLIADRRGRGCKITKCYLCLFICLRYRCVHLEAVSELSKDAFMLSLRRFIARRGKPQDIYCDNGTNFVGAAREINQFFKLHSESLVGSAADQNINFHFSPAYAPNFNGLAEAGIKSAKFHIKRILGTTHLTYEELSSLFIQIEAILNSRPICPLSTSPSDLSPLTPGHFLLGRSLATIPAPNLEEVNANRLTRFQRLEQIRQHFWRRWQREYVTELQQRTKWKVRSKDLRIGEMVLLKEDNMPPLHWRMGRVIKMYPGVDGVPRVADVTTSKGIIRRALSKICPLYEEDVESQKLSRPAVCTRPTADLGAGAKGREGRDAASWPRAAPTPPRDTPPPRPRQIARASSAREH